MVTVSVVGPGSQFASGIANYTYRLSEELGATPILYRHMMPKLLFPGKERVGKTKSKISYTREPVYLDWYNPITWMYGIKTIRKSDVVIYQWWSSAVYHMILFLTLISRRKYVIELHEVLDPMEGKNPVLKAYSKLVKSVVFRLADGLVVHNSMDADRLNKYKEKVTVIPHAVYDHFKKHNREDTGKFVILFFGLIRDYKGLPTLIKAVDMFDVPNKQLVIAGENWDRIPIPESNYIVHYNRYIDDNEIERLFSNCDALVLPYLRGSASGVAAIGMHYGIPIIASRVEGIYEQLQDYEGVFWIDPGDVIGLTQWLYSLYTRRRNRYPVPERLQWSTIKSNWFKILQVNDRLDSYLD